MCRVRPEGPKQPGSAHGAGLGGSPEPRSAAAHALASSMIAAGEGSRTLAKPIRGMSVEGLPAPTEALACWLMEDANVDMAASRFDRDGVLADASASGLGLAQDNDPDRRAHETERKMTERFSMLISVMGTNIVNSVRDKRIPEGASHKRGLYARCDAPGGSGAADDRRQSRRHESWLPPR
jgi:hypothetical protein